MKDWTEHKPAQFEFVGGWVRNWFSNMAPSEIIIDERSWPSVENYYQAQKTTDDVVKMQIRIMTPNKAKQAGRKVVFLRSDWQHVKYDIMKQALWVKFMIPEWQEKLLATADEQIIEWNNWGDKIWGVTINDGVGENLLGKALMEIRETIKKAKLENNEQEQCNT